VILGNDFGERLKHASFAKQGRSPLAVGSEEAPGSVHTVAAVEARGSAEASIDPARFLAL
jgi:hypothetical protein